MMPTLFLDVETTSLPQDQLLPIMPEFEAPGNLKDPDKIMAALEAKRMAWLDSAALKATTGRIIAVTTAENDDDPMMHASISSEVTLLKELDRQMFDIIQRGGKIYGWNLFGFDLPFFCQRCAVHNIPAFSLFRYTTHFKGRWGWNEAFVDAMQVWCGPYQRSDGASLKAVAHALGVGEKSGDGKDFADLLRTDPAAAEKYALNDVLLLRAIVKRMGI